MSDTDTITADDTTLLADATDLAPRKKRKRKHKRERRRPHPPLDLTADYLMARECAAYRRRSVRSLDRERAEGSGPPYIRDGSRILYRRTDVDAWLAAHVRGAR
jgi:hypothetical protein